MNALVFLLLLLVPPLIIIQYISSWERSGYHSNSWWGLLGWSVGAFTIGTMLMPFMGFFSVYAMIFYLAYTPLWGCATAKIINGIVIKTAWRPDGFGKALVGLIVGLFVATSLISIVSYLIRDLTDPPVQLCIFITGIASGLGAGIMSQPFDKGLYD